MLDWIDATIKIRTHIVLNQFSIHIPKTSFGIMGDNATGKTTLLKAIAGIIPVYGELNQSIPKEECAFIPFHSHIELSHGVSNYRQLRWNNTDTAVVPKVCDLFQTEILEIAKPILKRFNLTQHLNSYIINLSNGEMRKLEIARALIKQPKYLIIDNAFTGLDKHTRPILADMLQQLHDDGIILILTAIDAAYLPDFINTVIEVKNGTTILHSKSQQASSNPVLSNKEFKIPLWNNHSYPHLVELKDVNLEISGKSILNKINWSVDEGEQWVLKGANGAGKTSLLNMVFGDNPKAYNQNIKLFGKQKGSGESIWDIKEKIGYISPELHQYYPARMTVEDVVCSGLFESEGIYKKPTSYQLNLVKQWLLCFDAYNLIKRKFDSLSTSEQRIILFTRTLIKNPPLLFLDEPFQGLDEEHKADLKNFLNQLALSTNVSMVFISHYENEIPSTFDKLIELDKGNVINYIK